LNDTATVSATGGADDPINLSIHSDKQEDSLHLDY